MPDSYLQIVRQFDRNVRLFLLSAALIGFTAAGGIQAVLMNLYLLRLGYGLDFVGQINAIGGLTFALFSLPVAMLCRRWGSHKPPELRFGFWPRRTQGAPPAWT